MGTFAADSVHVELGLSMDAKALSSVCNRFGKVCNLDISPSQGSEATVSYYDVRSAASAAASLKDLGAKSSRLIPRPKMHRGVVLLGSEQLGMQELRHVRYVHYDSGSGMYTVEFFDSRIAARYRKVVGDTVSMGGCELGEEHASLSRSVATAASFYPVCVEPPPGLAPAQAPVEEPPPGLGSNSASAAPKACRMRSFRTR